MDEKKMEEAKQELAEKLRKQDQTEKIQQAFDTFDQDHTGFIDKTELRMALEEMGHKPTDEELYKMLHRVNKEGKNIITFEDFKKIIENERDNRINEEYLEILYAFEALGGKEYGKGDILLEDIKTKVLEEFELSIDLNKLLKEIGKKDAASITFDEFFNLLLS